MKQEFNKKSLIIWSSIVTLILVALLVFFFRFLGFNPFSKMKAFRHGWFFVAIGAALASFSLSSLVGFSITLMSGFTISKRMSLYINYTEGFLKGVFPYKTGYLSFVDHYYRKNGVKKEESYHNTILNFIINSSGILFTGSFIILFYMDRIISGLNKYSAIIFVAFALYAASFFLVILFVYSKGFNKFVIKLLSIFKINKAMKKKIEGIIIKFPLFVNNFKYVILTFTKTISNLIIFYVPFFISLSIGINLKDGYITFVIISFMTFLMSTYAPTPGGSISYEITFFLLSKSLTDLGSSDLYLIIFLTRFITYYLWIIFGLIFYALIFIREARFKKYQIIRNNKLLTKERHKIPYDILYLSDDFDTKRFMDLFKVFKTLNINVLILAKNIKDDLKLPYSDIYTLVKIKRGDLKKRLMEILNDPPEVFVTNTSGYFGINARKFAYNTKAPLVFVKDTEHSKKDFKLMNESDLIVSFSDSTSHDNIISLNHIPSSDYLKLSTMIIERLNVYNIKKIHNIYNARILILGEESPFAKDLAEHIAKKGIRTFFYSSKRAKLNKMVKRITGTLSHNDLYKLFKNNDFDIVIDLINDDFFGEEKYNILFNLLIDYNINYYISIDKYNNTKSKESLIPREDPIINTARENHILNILSLKLPKIIGITNQNTLSDIINSDRESFNLIHLYDAFKIIEIALKNIIKFNLNDSLRLNNLFDKEYLISINNNYSGNHNFIKKENHNISLQGYEPTYDLIDMFYLEKESKVKK